ncbi:DNA-processing protein DprA [Actinoallomurus oryzae]|uniref:DNA-processing protein DprA n=1 Tax=Actinoallomurus oryzae TaxID=502180 RepID=A0ABP8Q6C9_9ACTN
MIVPAEERLARALLTAVAEPGDERLGRLVDSAGAEGALEAIRADETPGGDDETELRRRFPAWRARLSEADPQRLLTVCEEGGGRLLCPGDAEWPSQLDDLGAARPYALWIRGDQDLRFGCLRSVAVVGARAASPYGVHVAAEMAAELADHGWTVVSGGAYGIDAAAHRGALSADGTTVAVFACGVDVAYPHSHSALFAEIAQSGLLVSEFPPGAPPTRPHFLIRNRVIAALTRGTVVVEAAQRSGAISTARHARDLARAVMVVPGPVTSPTSAGCHTLLREWGEAVCVTDTADVLDRVGLIGDDLAPERRGPVLDRDRLGPAARNVLEALPARGGAGAARIAVTAGVDLDTALTCLGALAAGGFIERCAKGWRLRRDSTRS